MSLRLRTLAVSLSVSVLIASCGGGNLASQVLKAPEVGQAMKGQAKCGIEKSQAKPLIVEWPSADRSELESKVRRGLVVVHYVGCDMSVLSRCSVPANYTYQATTRNQDKVEMKDEDDLYANLPVGAAKLEGKLQRSGRLTVDMNLVGRFEAEKQSVMASDLQGDCAGATHFVYGLTVGAFDFYAGGKADVSGVAGIGTIGARGGSQSEREDLTKAGDVAACSKATSGDRAPPDGCGALIRIEVVPISEVQSAVSGPPPASSSAHLEHPQPPAVQTPPADVNTGQMMPAVPMVQATTGLTAAEAAIAAQFARIDRELRQDYDTDTGQHTYGGSAEDVVGVAGKGGATKDGQFTQSAKAAQKYVDALEPISTSASREWATTAIARQGTVYDALRTGLYRTVPPALHYFTARQDFLLTRLEGSGVQKLQEQADDLRTSVKEAWRKEKEADLAATDALMVQHYAEAIALARKHNVRNALVTYATERLAYFTDIVGEVKMREYVTKTKDPADRSGARKLAYTDGMYRTYAAALRSSTTP